VWHRDHPISDEGVLQSQQLREKIRLARRGWGMGMGMGRGWGWGWGWVGGSGEFREFQIAKICS